MLLNTSDNKQDKTDVQLEEQLRQYKEEEVKYKFIDSTNIKGTRNRLNHKIDLAIKAADDELERKRNQLRSKLLEDEACLTFEFVEKAQKHAAKLYKQKKEKATALVETYEKNRLEYVDEMYKRLKVINCDELRKRATTERRISLAEAHKLQIKEKEHLKEKEKEYDMMYHNLMKTLTKYDADNAIKRKHIVGRAEVDELLKIQIIGREYAKAELESLKDEEKEMIKKQSERLAEEDAIELERIEKRKVLLKKIILDQLELKHEKDQKNMNYEKETDKIMVNELLKEMAEMKQTDAENKLHLAEEMDKYAQVYKEINKFKKHLEDKDNEVINTIAEDRLHELSDYRTDANLQKHKTAKEQQTYWSKQILNKENNKEFIKDVAESEKKLYETCNVNIDVARNREILDDTKKLQDDLKSQIEYNELTKKREKSDHRKLELDLLDEDEGRYEECVQLGSKVQGACHPFYRALFQCKK